VHSRRWIQQKTNKKKHYSFQIIEIRNKNNNQQYFVHTILLHRRTLRSSYAYWLY
jgi:hypothetical protein